MSKTNFISLDYSTHWFNSISVELIRFIDLVVKRVIWEYREPVIKDFPASVVIRCIMVSDGEHQSAVWIWLCNVYKKLLLLFKHETFLRIGNCKLFCNTRNNRTTPHPKRCQSCRNCFRIDRKGYGKGFGDSGGCWWGWIRQNYEDKSYSIGQRVRKNIFHIFQCWNTGFIMIQEHYLFHRVG